MPSLLIDIEGRFDKFKSSIDGVNSQVEKTSGHFDSMSKKINAVVASLAALVSVAALEKMTKDAIAASAAMDTLSQQTRLSVEEISALQLVSKQSGVAIGTVANAVKHLREEAASASGGDEKSADAFKLLGINPKSTNLLSETVGKLDDLYCTLLAARLLISEKSSWTQDYNARDRKGQGVYSDNQNAICWCAIGAVFAV